MFESGCPGPTPSQGTEGFVRSLVGDTVPKTVLGLSTGRGRCPVVTCTGVRCRLVAPGLVEAESTDTRLERPFETGEGRRVIPLGLGTKLFRWPGFPQWSVPSGLKEDRRSPLRLGVTGLGSLVVALREVTSEVKGVRRRPGGLLQIGR